MPAIPSAEDQVAFLGKLQRLLAEGDFQATYKYALLAALADLAVEHGTDDDRPLDLWVRQIGARFIEFYWRHAAPYGVGRADATPGVLVQNKGIQAAVISNILTFREQTGVVTELRARSHPAYGALLSEVSDTVSKQPLKFLQNFGGSTDEFLYERAGRGKIRLKIGVAYQLRRYHALIQDLVRSRWLGFIRANRMNRSVLGEADDLEEFLFETSRRSLVLMGEGLRKLDGAVCFYCKESLREADVDHFVPFVHYARDLAHNFVLAHPECNRSKSDTLAGRPHLERWLERLEVRQDAVAQIGFDAGIVVDPVVCRRVAAWGYDNAAMAGGQAWIRARLYEPIDGSYRALFQ